MFRTSYLAPNGTFFRAEVRAAHAHPCHDVLGVRDVGQDELLSFGTGFDPVPESLSHWRILRPFLAEQQVHSQKVAVISPWRVIDFNNCHSPTC